MANHLLLSVALKIRLAQSEWNRTGRCSDWANRADGTIQTQEETRNEH